MGKESTVAVVSTLKDSPENILNFVRYHQRIGIRRMYLFFDDEKEPIPRELENKHDVTCFIREDPPAMGHAETSVQERMESNADKAHKLARAEGFDWLLQVDGDEFVSTCSPMEKLFRTVADDVDVIRFSVMESVPADINGCSKSKTLLFKDYIGLPLFEDLFEYEHEHLAKHQRRVVWWRRRQKVFELLAGLFGFDTDKIRLFGHLNGKAAVRTSAKFCRFCSHFPTPCDGRKLKTFIMPKARLLHFDCRNFEDWRMKWTLRTGPENQIDNTLLSPQRINFLNSFASAAEDGEIALKEFYRACYQLSTLTKLLLLGCGLLKRRSCPTGNH